MTFGEGFLLALGASAIVGGTIVLGILAVWLVVSGNVGWGIVAGCCFALCLRAGLPALSRGDHEAP